MSKEVKVSTLTEGDEGLRLEYGQGHVVDITKSDGHLALDILGPFAQGMLTYIPPDGVQALKDFLNRNF